jgi:antibiotic biosynthesis monooxygenase (ABM) superfamily enzyme
MAVAKRPIMTRPDLDPSLSSARTPPSIHVQAVLTWLAIFPLVVVGITAMAPFTSGWDPLLRVFVLTLITVPLAVYLVVPWLVRIYLRYLAPRR